jgi:hypothetical protein
MNLMLCFHSLRRSVVYWITLFTCVVAVCPCKIGLAQLIGTSPSTTSRAEEESSKMATLMSKLAERLTTQELNIKKIACNERVVVERTPAKGAGSVRVSQDFRMAAEVKQRGSFSTDTVFEETHSPAGPPDAGIDTSQLVRDSFSAAAEFMGLNHQEAYAQRFLRKESLDGRAAFVVALQTVKQLESRKISIGNTSMPMRIAGAAWIDADNGTLLRLEVRQTKLPRDVREFSYDLRYTVTPVGYLLPATVHFKQTRRDESISTTQTFSNCTVN